MLNTEMLSRTLTRNQFLLTAAGLSLAAQSPSPSSFRNPLPVAIGDPFVLYHAASKRYYMYGTGGVRDGFGVHSSTDLVNWKFEGPIYQGNTPTSWCISHFWAPEVYQVRDRFYLFYSAQWRDNPTRELENFRIGVAVSDRPTGPFRDLQNAPLLDPGYPIIDANVFFDRDGRVYLYYSRCCYKNPVETEIAKWARDRGWYQEIEESWVYGVELKPDLSGVIGQPLLLLRPPLTMDDQQAEWESRSVTSREVNRRWTEGSFTFRHGDTYYMMYSANHFAGENYAVGYATAKAPLGPYTKAANNPVLEKNTGKGGDVTGTGHNSIAFSPDGKQMYCVYHGRTSKTGDQRVVFIDRMEILPDGRLVVHGPTTTPQPLPGI
jgi:beta-xylosidase